MSSFDQTCVLVRPDACPVSIRRVSCIDQTCVLVRPDSSRCIGSSRQLTSDSSRLLVLARRLNSAHLARLGSTARLGLLVSAFLSSRLMVSLGLLFSASRSSRLIGSSRLARLRISLVSAHRLVSAFLVC